MSGIDPGQPIRFHFDGRAVQGFAGDTVASALLRAGQRLVARSFKYHRPRGVVSLGSDEPSALVTLGRGAAQTPNQRATMVEIHEGLEVFSQNAWPSLARDLQAVNDLAAPFLGAGFYYKTFLWPRRAWFRLYEPIIRRAAGLGALSGLPDRGLDEKAFAFCDLLVIGAGPAGLMAALTAARAGADVILADEGAAMGGRLLYETEDLGGMPATAWVAAALAELAGWPNVRLMPRTTVTGVYDHGTFAALERLPAGSPERPRECFWRIVATRTVLSTGAGERMIAFPGNDRPGVMLAGAVRGYLNRFGVLAGRRVVVFAANDDAHRTARDLAGAGAAVVVVDPRPEAVALGDYPLRAGSEVVATRGRAALSSVALRDAGGRVEWLAADCLAVSGGWNPTLQLACHLGAKPHWDEAVGGFVMAPDAVPGMAFAGAVAGVFSTRAALSAGIRAGAEAARALGLAPVDPDLPAASDAAGAMRLVWQVAAPGRAFVDLANDVTVKDLQLAAAEGMGAPEHAKRYTTQGMAPDQGRGSNTTALAVLADATASALAAGGTTTARPPFVPVSISAMGAGGAGRGFAPVRLTPAHAAALARGAVMIEAGPWLRASHFLRPGESGWATSCAREVAYVRHAVAVADVSSLSRFDIQGPDAAEFLQRICTNTISTLKPGHARYTLLLREDGQVMEDGPLVHLEPGRFWLYTSSGSGEAVRRHLELAAQGYWPDLRLRIFDATENWAQFAIAGPRARDLLAQTLDSLPDLVFMGAAPVSAGGARGWLMRISYSGELGYELALPARYGDAAFRALCDAAEALGGGAYGLEAMNVLRIEKGFLTHAEIDGRVSAEDLGLGRMLRASGGHIGAEMAARPAFAEAGRKQLVGLRPLAKAMPIAAGGHLFAQGAVLAPENDLGHVTSACDSPTLGHPLALALLRDGRGRHGETLRLWDGLRGTDQLVEVTAPTTYDPEGGRARG
ncbi:2Fe-2S iron-sulfur cluster-binding protein [Phaeovulum sp.]|uniref:2Fe-2S iron-sulfur cluster-binding protein n=1 Tax=Phaeovulum sp. TaxID=2934796 RepID=UPI00272F7E56|nr:2Fe-2S iron-sulfur cluster-binding protein [Phaeovulum sp.]MDP1669884.1 2Fe-2S iron-sulfur cluster-binding protein [Phaeovulum sp.]MDZ4118596.1 2Fe-2S iron-sulfur cluster-binding protein [Phaeovulum sp.]